MATAIGSYATSALVQELLPATLSGADATLLGKICDRVNQYIETRTRYPVAPIASATYLYDSDGLRRIFLPRPASKGDGSAVTAIGGIRAATLVEVATQTGGDFSELDDADWFLRGRANLAGPYRWLLLSDKPIGTTHCFPRGIATVRVTGSAGWDAIPDDLTETALVIAQRAWNAHAVGQQDVTGNDEQGQPLVSRFVSGRDKETIMNYRLRAPY